MAIVNRTALLARREVKKAISKVRRTLRSVLSGESFGEREVEALTISGEAVRELLREELQEIAKRFKVTGTGRLSRRQAMRSHLLEKKSSKRVRRLGRDQDVAPGDARNVKRLLGI